MRKAPGDKSNLPGLSYHRKKPQVQEKSLDRVYERVMPPKIK
jgi:hypothetical protein